jgi:hypothetical protein
MSGTFPAGCHRTNDIRHLSTAHFYVLQFRIDSLIRPTITVRVRPIGDTTTPTLIARLTLPQNFCLIQSIIVRCGRWKTIQASL